MDKTIREIITELETTGKCNIKGFGTFYTAVQKGRSGVSAFNGKPWKTEDKTVVRFSQSASLDSSNYTVKGA